MIAKALEGPVRGIRTAPEQSRISFPPFELDVAVGLLFHRDRPLAMRPKTWAVLLYLVERPGLLVSSDELLDALWPDVSVTPGTINKSIGELREVLGDDAKRPRFIETVPRRGFRFVADVQRAPVAVTPAAAEPAARPSAFVGREEELALLASCLNQAHGGERQIVFVTGPAGVGKTALMNAFLDSRAMCEGVLPVWLGRAECFEHYGPQEPYSPVFEALERLARPPKVERLVRLMRRAAPMWLAQMPWLIGDADAEVLRRSLDGVRSERMPRELAALIEALTADVTLVLILEDLHWSDPSTVDILTLLAHRREPQRLLVIGTYRPSDLAVREHVLANAVRTLAAHQLCLEVPLHDLGEPTVGTYLDARFPGHAFPPALVPLIHAHTGGQPLFLVAVINQLLSRGWILETAPGWALSTELEMLDLGIPDDVRRMIETQLHGMSPADRELLEAASIAGNPITAEIVGAATRCEPAAAERRCETLTRAGQFLRLDEPLEWPDGRAVHRYRFTHELHRQVVYEETPASRRAQLHQAVGEAFEHAYAARAADIAPQLALHYQRGLDPARAGVHVETAGHRALRRFACREAAAYFEAAIVLLAHVPDPGERQRRELGLRLALGRALADLHGFAAGPVRTNYDRIAELCATVASPTELFEALYARWYFHALHADRDDANALAAELTRIAERLATASHGVIADSVLVRTAFYDGRFADARRHMQALAARAASAPEVGDGAVPYGVEPFIAATIHAAAAEWYLGDPRAARTRAHAGLARARESGNPLFLSAALSQVALVELLCRNSAAGAELADQARTLAAAQGFAFWTALAEALSGWAAMQQGHAAAGTRGVERALEAVRATGTRFFLAYMQAFLAEGHLLEGALEAGLHAIDTGLELASTSLDRGYAAELWRLKGELLLAAGTQPDRRRPRTRRRVAETSPAEQCLLRALETARAADARSLELRAATSLARGWRTEGRREEALALLGAVCDGFADDLDSHDLSAARTLLGELATQR